MHPNVVVVLNAGGGVDFTGWYDAAKAILMAWYPGQEGGQAIAEILTGKISPSGKLPISIEKKWEDNPVHGSYYENLKAEIKRVDYSEGVFVGYRDMTVREKNLSIRLATVCPILLSLIVI